MAEHIVSVIATRDRDDQPAYRAVCSCNRLRALARRQGSVPKFAFALAEHDGREHRKYRTEVSTLTARESGR